MTYVSATLTQLSTRPHVTIKARGKKITLAVDVSQMILKRMDTVGYVISDVRISSDSLTSQDGKQRNVSNMEIDITKNNLLILISIGFLFLVILSLIIFSDNSCGISHMLILNDIDTFENTLEPEFCENLLERIDLFNETCEPQVEILDCG